MLLIWGSQNFEEVVGSTNITGHCSHCHNKETMIIKKIGRKFTFFWIPLFTIEATHYVVCPVCFNGWEIHQDEISQYII